MKLNNSKRWSIGLWVVAMQKNERVHKTLNTSPYQLLYGQVPRVKASTLPWDKKLLTALETEVQLEKLLGSKMIHEEGNEVDEEELSDDSDFFEDEEDVAEELLPLELRTSFVMTAMVPEENENEVDDGLVFSKEPVVLSKQPVVTVVDLSYDSSGSVLLIFYLNLR